VSVTLVEIKESLSELFSVADHSNLLTSVLYRPNTVMADSNSTGYIIAFSVLSCVGTGLAVARTAIEGVLPKYVRINNFGNKFESEHVRGKSVNGR
jgi:hypothetical protein